MPIDARRQPQQARSEQRVMHMLEAAADLIAEVGYEAATMTALAERCNASIGAIYRYFPSKEALGRALRVQYSNEMAAQWRAVEATSASMTTERLVDALFDLMLEFIETKPAYLILVGSQLGYRKAPDPKNSLRRQFANTFHQRNSSLSLEQALVITTVMFQLMKSLNAIYVSASKSERRVLADEYRIALKAYLGMRLGV